VQPRGDALDLGLGERIRERLDERVAPRAVAGAHPAQMPIKIAAGEKPGERVLVDPGAAEVGVALLAADGLAQAARDYEPADPERRGERLAGRSGVDDAVGLEAPQRADGGAVVAVLRVIVVLDRDPAMAAQPGEERRAPVNTAPVGNW
jgi:hypothetical protein